MLAHSRGGSGERQPVDLNALVEEALNLAYHGARAQDQNFNITLERDFAAAIAPIELVPQDITRVFLNLIGNGFYAAEQARPGGARPGLSAGAQSGDARTWRRGRDSRCATTAPASRPSTATSCSSRSSPPSRPARAPGSAFRSATTSSPSSMAARSPSTANPARLPNSPSACRARRARGERGDQRERQHPDCRRRARRRRIVPPAVPPRGAAGHLRAAFRRLRTGGADQPRRRDRARADRDPFRHQHAGDGRAGLAARGQAAASRAAGDDGHRLWR